MSDMSAKVVVVTGAASGIGRACAKAFALAGARVAMLDRDAETLAASAKPIEGALGLVTDVAQQDSIEAAVRATREAFGGIDVLVNSAGVESTYTIERMPLQDWDRVLDVNLRGVMLCTQAVVPAMEGRGGGAIVNIASVAGKRISFHGGAAYTASKAGVLGFTRHAAFELGIKRIRVNAICPGPTLTPMITRNATEAEIARTEAIIPLGRWVMPEDVAQAALFLASDAAAMCTGTSIDVDGGVLVSNGSSYQDYFARRK
ncbi:MAG: SDR family oxidoreductase [Burkholderiaceae bacterium]|nr:SDR family oxidoreductase [Burkholderiaceae bacterium]